MRKKDSPKSFWTYRVFHNGRQFYIGEAYYEGEKLVGFTGASDPYGETVEELANDLKRMLVALDRPVLNAVEEERRAKERTKKGRR